MRTSAYDSAGLAALRAVIDRAPQDTPPELVARARAVLDELDAAAGRLLSVADVAAQLRVSVDTVRRLIAAGVLDAVRLGYRTVRVPAGAVTRYRAGLPDA